MMAYNKRIIEINIINQMEKTKRFLKNVFSKTVAFLTTPIMKRLYWNTANGAVSIATVTLADLDLWYAPAIFGLLNGATREINKKLSK